MLIQRNVDLKPYNTFGISVTAELLGRSGGSTNIAFPAGLKDDGGYQ
jgi:hypothetical protein